MNVLIEFILDIIVELFIWIPIDKNDKKRIPLFVLIIFSYLFLLGLILLAGIVLVKENILYSVLFFALELVIVVGTIVKFYKISKSKKVNK